MKFYLASQLVLLGHLVLLLRLLLPHQVLLLLEAAGLCLLVGQQQGDPPAQGLEALGGELQKGKILIFRFSTSYTFRRRLHYKY